MNLLRNRDDENAYLAAVAERTGRTVADVARAWNPPARYPCMVACTITQAPDQQLNMTMMYVYAEDCISLMQHAGYRVFFDPTVLSPNAVPLPNILEFHRQSSALMMAILAELNRVGIMNDMTDFEKNLAHKLGVVDQLAAEMAQHGPDFDRGQEDADPVAMAARRLYPVT